LVEGEEYRYFKTITLGLPTGVIVSAVFRYRLNTLQRRASHIMGTIKEICIFNYIILWTLIALQEVTQILMPLLVDAGSTVSF
jgi:hypothetical protein